MMKKREGWGFARPPSKADYVIWSVFYGVGFLLGAMFMRPPL